LPNSRRADQVDVDHQAEIGDAHLGEAPVAQDTRIIDQDVDPPPAIVHSRNHRRHPSFVGHRCGGHHRLAAHRRDLRNHRLGWCAREIVDDDLRTVTRQEQRVRPAESAARPRHDRDLSLKLAGLLHHQSPIACFCRTLSRERTSTATTFTRVIAYVDTAWPPPHDPCKED
jgi:hypothetical protein